MISLIATVLNEKNSITDWLNGILSQSILPQEIIIVDGGSTDGTWEVLQEKSMENNLIKVWQNPGNISTGRNFAIAKAQGQAIVVTDAGCTYNIDWFKKISRMIALESVDFAATGFGPWFQTDDSLLIRLIAAATIPAPTEFKKDWLPSSRSVAFRKEIWHMVGGYPEWIPLCEDVIFDLKILKLGIKPEYIREPLVFWRPRTTLKAFFKQLFGYTRSDGHGGLWLRRQIIRYASYVSGMILIFLGFKISPIFIILLLVGILVYMKKFWLRWSVYSQRLYFMRKITGFILLPLIVAYGDVAKMCGWPVGVYEKKKGIIRSQD